jgi:hypothetical protein
MPRRSLIDRLLQAFGRDRGARVLVLVNTTQGPRAVPMRVRDLR